MRLLGFARFRYTAQMWLPLEQPGRENAVETFVKDVMVDLTNDPSAPRQVIVCAEPLPRGTFLTALTDLRGEQPVPGAEWTITSIEPVMNPLGFRELYRMQAAQRNKPNFGYEGIVL